MVIHLRDAWITAIISGDSVIINTDNPPGQRRGMASYQQVVEAIAYWQGFIKSSKYVTLPKYKKLSEREFFEEVKRCV